MKRERLYNIRANIKQRCNNVNHRDYHRYGGRGIRICNEWSKSYLAFKEWSLNNGYKENLSIDRIDNDGDYSPDNCRWTTRSIQNTNTRVLRSDNSSGYRGVNLHKGRWQARISVNGKRIHIGSFDNPEDAAIAYNNYVEFNSLQHKRNSIKETRCY